MKQSVDEYIKIHHKHLSILGTNLSNAIDGCITAGGHQTRYEHRNALMWLKENERPEFTQEIFMGSPSSTTPAYAMLFLDLAGALDWLSGDQQNGGMGGAFDDKYTADSLLAREVAVRSIANALGCKHLLDNSEVVP